VHFFSKLGEEIEIKYVEKDSKEIKTIKRDYIRVD